MEDFLETVDQALDTLADSSPENLDTALAAIDVILAEEQRTDNGIQFQSRILDLFLSYPSTRRLFYDFVKVGTRQGVDDPPEYVAPPLGIQFARLRLIRNKRITKHPIRIESPAEDLQQQPLLYGTQTTSKQEESNQ